MVTFCLGSARQKREYIKSISGAVVLDNVEVLFCASENGRNYFAYGDVPFGGFSVREYLDYRRALNPEKVNNADIVSLGIKPRKKLSRLNPVELRAVQFLEKSDICDGAPVVVNLDGTKFTRRRLKALMRLLSWCGEGYVFITDDRFFDRAECEKKSFLLGSPVGKKSIKFYTAKRLAALLDAKRIAIM